MIITVWWGNVRGYKLSKNMDRMVYFFSLEKKLMVSGL